MQILPSFFLSFFFVLVFRLFRFVFALFAWYQVEVYTFDDVIADVSVLGSKGVKQMMPWIDVGMAHFMGESIKILLHREIYEIAASLLPFIALLHIKTVTLAHNYSGWCVLCQSFLSPI